MWLKKLKSSFKYPKAKSKVVSFSTDLTYENLNACNQKISNNYNPPPNPEVRHRLSKFESGGHVNCKLCLGYFQLINENTCHCLAESILTLSLDEVSRDCPLKKINKQIITPSCGSRAEAKLSVSHSLPLLKCSNAIMLSLKALTDTLIIEQLAAKKYLAGIGKMKNECVKTPGIN